jgi:antitoxin HicB
MQKDTKKNKSRAPSKKPRSEARSYPALMAWSDEDSCFVASVPALRGCMSHGESMEEAARNIADATESWLDAAEAAGIEIPDPPEGKSGNIPLRMPRWLHELIAVRAEADGVSVNQWVTSVLAYHIGRNDAVRPHNRTNPADDFEVMPAAAREALRPRQR